MPYEPSRIAAVALSVALGLAFGGCDWAKDYFSEGAGDLGTAVTRQGMRVAEEAKGRVEVALDDPWDQAEDDLSDALSDATYSLEGQAEDMLDDATGATGDSLRRRADADDEQDPFAY